jgi:hypothetical protein
MLTITTAMTSNNSGRSGIIAKGHGRQRTVPIDPAKSPDQNNGAAVGALLDVLCDDRQKDMLRHPSGGQRVRVEYTNAPDAFAVTRRWSINV